MSMKETMEQEREEAIATLERANSALSRIFNMEEEEEEGDDGTGICDMCAGCPNCVEEEEGECVRSK